MITRNGLIEKVISLLKKAKQNEPQPSQTPFFSKDIKYLQEVSFGDYTYGQPIVYSFGEPTKLKVGKFCSIAGDVRIYLGGNHRMDWITTYPFNSLPESFPESTNIKGHPVSKGDVVIGNDVWLGGSCVILSGVTIGDGAVVGTNSVVTKNIGPYEVYVGNPARFIKKRFSDSDISKLLEMKWWDWELKDIKRINKVLCSEKIDELYDFYCSLLK